MSGSGITSLQAAGSDGRGGQSIRGEGRCAELDSACSAGNSVRVNLGSGAENDKGEMLSSENGPV